MIEYFNSNNTTKHEDVSDFTEILFRVQGGGGKRQKLGWLVGW